MGDLVFKYRKWWKSEWDLYRGEQIIGSLVAKNKISFSLAEITIGSKRWEVGYKGWLGNSFLINDGSGTPIETSRPGRWWDQETDVVLQGRRYRLSNSFWYTKYMALDEGGTPVVVVTPHWNGTASVTFTHSENETTLLLAFLLFYRLKLAEMSAAAGGGGGS